MSLRYAHDLADGVTWEPRLVEVCCIREHLDTTLLVELAALGVERVYSCRTTTRRPSPRGRAEERQLEDGYGPLPAPLEGVYSPSRISR